MTANRAPFVRAFMTHAMSDAEIEALSTGREEEFARILDAIGRSRRAAPGSVQHVAVYGPRGFGKSFLTRRAQIAAAQMGGERGPVRYVLLPEEQHNLQKSPHALLETIAARLEGLERGDDSAFREAAFRWPKPAEEARRWEQAVARLERAIDVALPEGRGLIVVAIENFDQLLATLFRAHRDEQRLRGWLDRSGNRLMVLATATGAVDTDYERPLFRMFQPVRLRPWSVDDCLAYFKRTREFGGKSPLDAEGEAKAKAVAEFIGGTPRLALSLAEVLDSNDALTVAATMDALAEKLAEYYRRRIEDLAPLGRGLLDALIRGGEPASATELARRVEAGQNQIAQFMKSLTVADVLRGEPARDGRETLYRVTDRVFAHYYRLREGSEAARDTPLATILDFLKSFYTRDEQQTQALKYLDYGHTAEAALFHRLAMEGQRASNDRYFKDFEYRLGIYLEASPDALRRAASEVAAQMDASPAEAYRLAREAQFENAVAEAIGRVVRAQALARMGDSRRARNELALLEQIEDAIAKAILTVETINLMSVAADLAEVARLGLALQGVAIRGAPARLRALCSSRLASTFNLNLDFERGKEAAIDAASLAREAEDRRGEAFALGSQAYSLFRLLRYTEAIETAARGAELAQLVGDIRTQAIMLEYQAYSLGQLQRHKEAIEVAAHGAELARMVGDAEIETQNLRLQAFSLAGLGRHEDAIACATRAADLAGAAGHQDLQSEALQILAYSLNEAGRMDEAWTAATSSVAIAKLRNHTDSLSWASVEALRTATSRASPEIVGIYRDWVAAWAQAKDKGSCADPVAWLSDLFIATARAGAFEALDALLGEYGEWLAENYSFIFVRDLLIGVAVRAADLGRATTFSWMAQLVPRIVAVEKLRPEAKRDKNWPTTFASTFASSWRDPAMLRDIATVFTPDLSPEAPQAATLLRAVAEVDEAADPELILARMDPDLATAIRRLRDLPDPAPSATKTRKLRSPGNKSTTRKRNPKSR